MRNPKLQHHSADQLPRLKLPLGPCLLQNIHLGKQTGEGWHVLNWPLFFSLGKKTLFSPLRDGCGSYNPVSMLDFRDSGLSMLSPKHQTTDRKIHIQEVTNPPFSCPGNHNSPLHSLTHREQFPSLQKRIKSAFWLLAGPSRHGNSFLGD